jgi:hypothetical protein
MSAWFTLVTTATGALSATVGVLVGGLVARRNQHRQWLQEKQLATYVELLGHYAKFSMILKRAHASRSGWDYDWGAWSATLIAASLIAPTPVAIRIDEFGRAVGDFLDSAARDSSTTECPLTAQEFADASRAPGEAQLRLVNEIRRSMGKQHGPLQAWLGGARSGG